MVRVFRLVKEFGHTISEAEWEMNHNPRVDQFFMVSDYVTAYGEVEIYDLQQAAKAGKKEKDLPPMGVLHKIVRKNEIRYAKEKKAARSGKVA